MEPAQGKRLLTELSSASNFSLSQLSECLSEAFSDYIVPAHFTPALLSAMNKAGGVDLEASIVALQEGRPVGCALIARRDDQTRLAGMGVVPVARTSGVGLSLVETMISASRQRGDSQIVLEAFEQNTRAVRLYEKAGFVVVRRLLGYWAAKTFGVIAEGTEEVAPSEYARLAGPNEPRDLPWQLAAPSAAYSGAPSRCFKLGDGIALISDPSQNKVALRGLIVSPGSREKGIGTALVRDLFAKFPSRQWIIPPIVPEGYCEPFLLRLGFRREPLAQVEMHLSLT